MCDLQQSEIAAASCRPLDTYAMYLDKLEMLEMVCTHRLSLPAAPSLCAHNQQNRTGEHLEDRAVAKMIVGSVWLIFFS
eukprot:g77588.t1